MGSGGGFRARGGLAAGGGATVEGATGWGRSGAGGDYREGVMSWGGRPGWCAELGWGYGLGWSGAPAGGGSLDGLTRWWSWNHKSLRCGLDLGPPPGLLHYSPGESAPGYPGPVRQSWGT